MTDDEFRQIVSQDSALAGPLKRAAAADSQQFILGGGEAAALVFMFPIAPVRSDADLLTLALRGQTLFRNPLQRRPGPRDRGPPGGRVAYAQAARRNYATHGDRAAAEIQRTQGLIEEIEQKMRGGSCERMMGTN
jgi:hypothetical protein